MSIYRIAYVRGGKPESEPVAEGSRSEAVAFYRGVLFGIRIAGALGIQLWRKSELVAGRERVWRKRTAEQAELGLGE